MITVGDLILYLTAAALLAAAAGASAYCRKKLRDIDGFCGVVQNSGTSKNIYTIMK